MGDRGTVLPAILVVVFGAIVAMALAVDLGRWAAAHRSALYAAESGVHAGAAMLDERGAYRGDLALDPLRAQATAESAAYAARSNPGRTASAHASALEVCVTVTQPFSPGLLRAAGVGSSEVRASACARPRQG